MGYSETTSVQASCCPSQRVLRKPTHRQSGPFPRAFSLKPLAPQLIHGVVQPKPLLRHVWHLLVQLFSLRTPGGSGSCFRCYYQLAPQYLREYQNGLSLNDLSLTTYQDVKVI